MAVDERPEVSGPPDPHLVLFHVVAGGEADLGRVGAGSDGKEAKAPGEGIDPLNVKNKVYDKHSFFTVMLPYMEHDNTYKATDLGQTYNAATNTWSSMGSMVAGGHPTAARRRRDAERTRSISTWPPN